MDKIEEEIELIRAFKKGDIEAFEKLFQKYHKKLYVFLFQLLHSKEDAEEIVQEAFIKIWEKREEFKEEHSFNSFLFTIAKNSFLNLNRKKINRRVIDNHLDFVEVTSSVNTDDYVIFQETKDILNLIINDLPPKRKEIFLLRRIEGLTRKEIAKELGISVITVDSQLTKANTYLKDQLKKYSILLLVLFLT